MTEVSNKKESPISHCSSKQVPKVQNFGLPVVRSYFFKGQNMLKLKLVLTKCAYVAYS